MSSLSSSSRLIITRGLSPSSLLRRRASPSLTLRSLSTTTIPSGPTTGTLQFYLPPPDGSRGWYYPAPVPGPPGSSKFNYIADNHAVSLADIRGREAGFSLDTHGFLPVPASDLTRIAPEQGRPDIDFSCDEDIEARYYPQVEQVLLANLAGATQVAVFDHTVRRGSVLDHPRRPVPRIHIDASPASALDRVKRRMFPHGGDAIDGLLRRRWQLINVWRPVNDTVLSWPLCFADSSSVPDEALEITEHRYSYRTGEVVLMRHVPAARWYYWSGMTGEERILLLQYDSKPGGARTPHGAFEHPGEWEGVRARDSIEVGVLAFY